MIVGITSCLVALAAIVGVDQILGVPSFTHDSDKRLATIYGLLLFIAVASLVAAACGFIGATR